MKNNIKDKKASPERSRRVFVGLSGGVDSAVSAALLKKEGYDVTGVFIKAWSPEGYPCTWREDRRSAMRAAAVLDIPFLTLDLEKEYKKEVVDYMIDEYKQGRTPNPDVMCNKQIKFGHFLKFALENGADFVATGHYARAFASPQTRGGRDEVRVGLMEGSDKNKDQSYFLYTLTPDQLSHTLFPIGHLQKSEVRKLAQKFGLPQAVRKDSQGVCFLGQIDMKEFLTEFVGAQKGDVLNESGEVIGSHGGSILYTIGERHGFKVNNKNTDSESLFVIAKDIQTNTITVAPHVQIKRSSKMYTEQVALKNINLMNEISNQNLSCRIRYRGEKIPCTFDGTRVIFKEPQFGVSPGQSVVFYHDEICLGGGIMK